MFLKQQRVENSMPLTKMYLYGGHNSGTVQWHITCKNNISSKTHQFIFWDGCDGEKKIIYISIMYV